MQDLGDLVLELENRGYKVFVSNNDERATITLRVKHGDYGYMREIAYWEMTDVSRPLFLGVILRDIEREFQKLKGESNHGIRSESQGHQE